MYQRQGATFTRRAELQVRVEADIGGLTKASNQADSRAIPELTFTSSFPAVTVADSKPPA